MGQDHGVNSHGRAVTPTATSIEVVRSAIAPDTGQTLGECP